MEADLLCQASGGCRWRVYSLDRPGMGISDFKHDRSLCDWPQDVTEFADSLGIGQFVVMGVSGGGPYAAACAWALPERVRAAGLVCGLGPVYDRKSLEGMRAFNRSMLALLHRFPNALSPTYRPIAFILSHWPLAMLDAHIHSLPLQDRAVLKDPTFRAVLANSFREAVRQGAIGGEQELKIYSSPWGFEPSEIKVPTGLWHGDLDTIVPCAMGCGLAAEIPRCRATIFHGDGHYSVLAHRRDEILETLLRIAGS